MVKALAGLQCSKHSLCSVPFDRKLLFGKTLESAIQRVSDGKSGLIPQERRRLHQSFGPSKRSKEGFREATAYQPGRLFFRQWKGAGPSFPTAVKLKANQAAKTQDKLFLRCLRPLRWERGCLIWQGSGQTRYKMPGF